MKILLLSPNQINRYNRGHQLFRNEIGRQHTVFYYGQGYPNFKENDVNTIIKKYCPWKPDVILTYGWRYSAAFEGLGSIKNIAKVHISVDYVPTAGIPKQNKFFKKNKYDLVLGITQYAHRLLNENQICDRIMIMPFSADTNIYKPLNVPIKNQVLASFTTRADVYPNRVKTQKVIKSMKIPIITKRVVHEKLIRCINESKIILTSNNIFKSLSMRYTETLACGGFLLADKPEDLEYIGLEDKKHLVIYKDLKDLKEKVKYYLTHEKERKKIAKQGMDFVRENHSCKRRAQEFTKFLNNEFGFK